MLHAGKSVSAGKDTGAAGPYTEQTFSLLPYLFMALYRQGLTSGQLAKENGAQVHLCRLGKKEQFF